MIFVPDNPATAQEMKETVKTEIKNPRAGLRALKTNPFILFWGTIPFTAEYRLCYEFVNSQSQASELIFSYLGRSPFLSLLEQDSLWQKNNLHFVVSGFRFQAEQKFYIHSLSVEVLSQDEYAPFGFYIAPHLSYATARFSSKYLNLYDIYIAVSQFNINLKMGAQFRIMNRFTVDCFGGIGYKNNVWAQHYSNINIKRISLEDIPKVYSGHVKILLGLNAGFTF